MLPEDYVIEQLLLQLAIIDKILFEAYFSSLSELCL